MVSWSGHQVEDSNLFRALYKSMNSWLHSYKSSDIINIAWLMSRGDKVKEKSSSTPEQDMGYIISSKHGGGFDLFRQRPKTSNEHVLNHLLKIETPSALIGRRIGVLSRGTVSIVPAATRIYFFIFSSF